MTVPRQPVVFYRNDMTLTVFDGDPDHAAIQVLRDPDDALAAASIVRTGAWERHGPLLIADTEPAAA